MCGGTVEGGEKLQIDVATVARGETTNVDTVSGRRITADVRLILGLGKNSMYKVAILAGGKITDVQ